MTFFSKPFHCQLSLFYLMTTVLLLFTNLNFLVKEGDIVLLLKGNISTILIMTYPLNSRKMNVQSQIEFVKAKSKTIVFFFIKEGINVKK